MWLIVHEHFVGTKIRSMISEKPRLLTAKWRIFTRSVLYQIHWLIVALSLSVNSEDLSVYQIDAILGVVGKGAFERVKSFELPCNPIATFATLNNF